MPFGYAKSNRTFTVATQPDALKQLAQLTQQATINPLVRNTALKIVRNCDSRDDLCELKAIFDAVKHGDPGVAPFKRGFKYVSDPRYSDYFTAPTDSIKSCMKNACGGDCLPSETLLLGAGYKFVPISDVEVGALIMGDGGWTRVTNKWNKGVQEILEFDLRNGCVLRCTPDHRLFRVPKTAAGYAGPRAEAEEVRARDVRPGDDLLTIESIPFGREAIGADNAWLLGVHAADGWIDYSKADGRPIAACISGLDGWRKEDQKRRVESICSALGIKTRWDRKYIEIQDERLACWLAACGRGAINKHVPSLDLDPISIRSLLQGLSADADIRDNVHGTISPQMALQLRVIYRMLGQSTHIRLVENHGGFGRNPIYRVTPRKGDAPQNSYPHARVRSISEGTPTETYDIETESSRFYLPETDLVVHNCDDHAALLCALAGSIGWQCGLRAWGRAGEFVHVYAVAAYPKRPPYSRVIGMDTTVKSSSLGWEPPRADVLTAWFS